MGARRSSNVLETSRKEKMNEGLDPSQFGISIEEIEKQIRVLGQGKGDKRPVEQYNTEMVEKYQNFAKENLGFSFNDISLFITALTHRSYVNEHKNIRIEHNERLEFLGDAILELVTSDFLFRNFYEHEGIMTAWRSALVRTESIAEASEEIGYVDLIRLSKGEQLGNNGARAHQSIIADCFEAVTGAIYMDQGYETAKKHIYKYILSKMQKMIEEEAWRDPKSYLQELSQKVDAVVPTYRTVAEDGPDHNRMYKVAVQIGNTVRGRGEGHSKQEAQVIAAKEAIAYYKSLNNTDEIDTGKLAPKNI